MHSFRQEVWKVDWRYRCKRGFELPHCNVLGGVQQVTVLPSTGGEVMLLEEVSGDTVCCGHNAIAHVINHSTVFYSSQSRIHFKRSKPRGGYRTATSFMRGAAGIFQPSVYVVV